MIENSGSSEPKEKTIPSVKIADDTRSPDETLYIDMDNGGESFYTDSDGQIVASGDVYFYKQPYDNKTYTSFYMKDANNAHWHIACDDTGSFKILETDNYVGLEFNNIVGSFH